MPEVGGKTLIWPYVKTTAITTNWKKLKVFGKYTHGLIGKDSIVEIKCRSSIAGKHIDKQTKNKKVSYWTTLLMIQLSPIKKHVYYDQVPGCT